MQMPVRLGPPLTEPQAQARGRIDVPPIDLKWHQQLGVLNISLLLFVVAVISSAGVLRGSGRDLDYLANIRGFLGTFFPPDFSVTGRTLIGLWETFQIAVMATAF